MSAERLARMTMLYMVEPGDVAVGGHLNNDGWKRTYDMLAASDRYRSRMPQAPIDVIEERALRAGYRFIIPGDDEWPRRLDDLGVARPIGLWVAGERLNQSRAIAFVGARACTSYGEHVTDSLIGDLRDQEVTVVSGAAYGIDGAAHRSALMNGLDTVAFMATGIDRAYPRGHDDLVRRIANAGTVVSEVPIGGTPTRHRFLMRNRLIAAFSRATVVVEAGYRSGSMNTAGYAVRLGRGLGAVPGPITSVASAGCHRIIAEMGGKVITMGEDILSLAGMK